MALIKLGPVVAGIAGSIGGTTFARSRAGYYARQRTKPVVPISPRRTAAQQIIGNLVQDWTNKRTDAGRTLWTQRAALTSLLNKLGESYTPTGLNLYVRSNAQLVNSAQTQVTVPPVQAIAPTFGPTLKHTPATGIQIATIGQFDPLLVGKILIFTAANLRQSVNFFKGPWDLMASGAIATVAAANYTVIATASLKINSRAFVAFVVVLADGSVSAQMIAYQNVGAVA